MKISPIIALFSIAASSASFCVAAEKAGASYPKNLARHHLGTNLFVYNEESGTFVPTEAAAAWLDDDVTTAWPPAAGKQYYLLALPEAQLMTNFEISAKDNAGLVSIYAGDEPSAPTAESWKPVAREVSIAEVNEIGMKNSFSRYAKYLLIETNIENPLPWFSLYVYGNRDASVYGVQKRAENISTDAIYGPFVNDQTSFSYSSLYADGKVSYADTAAATSEYSNAIDDNPQTSLTLNGKAEGADLQVSFNEPRTVERVAVLANRGVKGRIDLFASATVGTNSAPDLADQAPVASLIFDGSSDRASMEFPGVSASSLVARWVPEDGSQPIEVREINAFDSTSVESYAVTASPEVIAEQSNDRDVAYNDTSSGSEGKGVLDYGDGKGVLDYGDGKKTLLDPIAELSKTPFVPGGLRFPPNLPPNERIPPPLPPEEPLSN